MTQRQPPHQQRIKPIYSINEVVHLLPLLTNLRELHILIAVLHSEKHLYGQDEQTVGHLLNKRYTEIAFGYK